jgi:retinoblastoma-associated protein
LTIKPKVIGKHHIFIVLSNKKYQSCDLCTLHKLVILFIVTSTLQNTANSYTTQDCAFPWILKVFEVKAYDFFKIIECFINSEPKLAKDLTEVCVSPKKLSSEG